MCTLGRTLEDREKVRERQRHRQGHPRVPSVAHLVGGEDDEDGIAIGVAQVSAHKLPIRVRVAVVEFQCGRLLGK